MVSCYYWKSAFELSPTEREWLEAHKVERLYVKYLDVDVENGRAVPKAPIRFTDPTYKDFEIVPCVFITNRTFQAAVNPEDLAERDRKSVV